MRVVLRRYGICYTEHEGIEPQDQTLRVFIRRALGLSSGASDQCDLVLLAEFSGNDLGKRWAPYDVWVAFALGKDAYRVLSDDEDSYLADEVLDTDTSPLVGEETVALRDDDLRKAYDQIERERARYGRCGIEEEWNLLPDLGPETAPTRTRSGSADSLTSVVTYRRCRTVTSWPCSGMLAAERPFGTAFIGKSLAPRRPSVRVTQSPEAGQSTIRRWTEKVLGRPNRCPELRRLDGSQREY